MNVLIACEESQRVCIAFRERGHNAFSCDIQEPSGGHPEYHIMGDVLDILNPFSGIKFKTMTGDEYFIFQWDLIIAHPPCTYLSNAGACRLYPRKGQLDRERYNKGMIAKNFFMQIWYSSCSKLCIENPIPSRIFNLPKYSQIIQPYQFGHPYTKRTCLWLRRLPKLKPTNEVEPVATWLPSYTSKQHDANHAGIAKSSKERAKTFEGIAQAMAEQWGK